MEVRRLLSVMEIHLKDKIWFINDEYTIVDMAMYPWVAALDDFFSAGEFLKVHERYPNVIQWCQRIKSRPAIEKGMRVCRAP